MAFSLNTPLSLYSIPVVWYTAFYPMNMKFALIQKTIGYNNLQPRSNTNKILDDPTVPRDVAERVQRLEGAHLNGNEILPLWIGAVVSGETYCIGAERLAHALNAPEKLAGNMAGIANKTLNIASAGFIAARVLYNYIYINQKTARAGWARSAIFFASLGFPMYLLVKAGNAMRKAH